MTTEEKKANAMWGGRFDTPPSEIMTQINASIDIDKRLYRQDIDGSKAHCQMLVQQKIITQNDGEQILSGLDAILQEIENGTFIFKTELEDIHMNIEGRLKELIGDVSGRLHTARSRNDQVATDFRLWTREASEQLIHYLEQLQKDIAAKSEQHKDVIMPGFTHLQVAQPLKFSTHLMAYHSMLGRDITRLQDCAKRLNECPLGACALAGTSFPNDRNMTAKNLGFTGPVENTMDAVASRDFALEFLSSANICMINLSRLAEELILWSTAQFSFIRLSDSYTTGSSIMPQKKNPDAAELIRAKTGAVTGNLVQLLMVMKALPLAYNKDMQEDKAPAFATFDTLKLCLQVMSGMICEMEINETRMKQDAESGFSTATDLADWLVKNIDMPFRQAHYVTGKIVKVAEEQNCKLDEVSLNDMQQIEPQITDDIFSALNAKRAVSERR